MGQWRLEGPGFGITHSFQGEPITRAIIAKVESKHTLALDLLSEIRRLEPGASITVRQVITIDGMGKD